MKYTITDLELADKFGATVGKDYALAVEFCSLYPDHSLMSYRQVLEGICLKLANSLSIDVSKLTLINVIDELFSTHIINHDLKSKMHDLRILGNNGVHRQNQRQDINLQEPEDEMQNNKLAEYQTRAVEQARKLTISVLEASYFILRFGDASLQIELTEINDQIHKETLFSAACSIDCDLKLKAGLIYESMALDKPLTKAIISSSRMVFHRESLLKLAAAHYEAAMNISAEIDSNLFKFEVRDQDEFIMKNCDIEPLFRFGLIASEGNLGETAVNRGREILKQASLRGHSEATGRYAAILYDEKDYSTAKQYALVAAENDNPIGYQVLFYYYSQGLACDIDESKAMEQLSGAIELGCAESTGLLGSLYAEGKFVEQDRDHASSLLLKAIENGSSWANRYYHVEFNDLAGLLSAQFKEKADLFIKNMTSEIQQNLKYIENNKPRPKIASNKVGRNDPCPCGSGYKYKKCNCMLVVQ